MKMNDKLLFSQDTNESNPLLRQLFAQPEERMVLDNPNKFTHIVITTGVYDRWYGLISYSLEDLNKMLSNHKKAVTKEDVCLFKGHGGFFSGGGRESLGTYSRDSKLNKIVKMKYKDSSGKEYDKYGLSLSGDYTSSGLEMVSEKELKYVSVEIYNNYQDREISSTMMSYFKVDSLDAALEKFNEKCIEMMNKDKDKRRWDVEYELRQEIISKAPSFGPTIMHIAATNEPFFHLPKVQDVTASQVIESFSMDASVFSSEYDNKIFRIGNDLMVSLGDNKFADINQFIHDNSEDGEKIRGIISRYGVSNISAGRLTFDLANSLDMGLNKESDTALSQATPKPEPADTGTQTREKMNIAEIKSKYSALSLAELEVFDTSDLSQEELFVFDSVLTNKKLEAEQLRSLKQKEDFEKKAAAMKADLERAREESALSKARAFSASVDSLSSHLNTLGVPKAIVDNITKFSSNLDPKFRDTKFEFSNAAEEFSFSGGFVDVIKEIFANVSPSVFATSRPENLASTKNPEDFSNKIDPIIKPAADKPNSSIRRDFANEAARITGQIANRKAN